MEVDKVLDRVRPFMKSSGKIAVGLLLAAGGVLLFEEIIQHQRVSGLSEPKIWPTITVPALDSTSFELKTRWRDDEVLYQFVVDGYPDVVREALEPTEDNPYTSSGSRSRFTLNFHDGAGFRLHSEDVRLSTGTRIVDSQGRPIGLRFEGSLRIDPGLYRDLENWDVTWSL